MLGLQFYRARSPKTTGEQFETNRSAGAGRWRRVLEHPPDRGRVGQRLGDFEPHEILGVAWDVSERALRSAYRRLALEHHPDKGGDPVRFQLIVTAYEALMNRLHGQPDF